MTQTLTKLPAVVNLRLSALGDLDATVPLEASPGVPADPSGWSVEAAMRPRGGGEALALAAAIVGSAVRVTRSREDCAAAGEISERWLYDVVLTEDAGPGREVPFEGTIFLKPAITQPGD